MGGRRGGGGGGGGGGGEGCRRRKQSPRRADTHRSPSGWPRPPCALRLAPALTRSRRLEAQNAGLPQFSDRAWPSTPSEGRPSVAGRGAGPLAAREAAPLHPPARCPPGKALFPELGCAVLCSLRRGSGVAVWEGLARTFPRQIGSGIRHPFARVSDPLRPPPVHTPAQSPASDPGPQGQVGRRSAPSGVKSPCVVRCAVVHNSTGTALHRSRPKWLK